MAERASGFERNAHDWYIESKVDVDRFLDIEPFDGFVWDPAAGSGNIPEACRARGMYVIGSDVVDRGWSEIIIQDFLKHPDRTTPDRMHIITNPPYHLATQFALKALSLVSGKVAILQRTAWLEGIKRHRDLWSKGHLMRVWQYCDRIRVPPGGIVMPGKQPSTAYAWFVFQSNYNGPYTGGWIQKRQGNERQITRPMGQPARICDGWTGTIPQSSGDRTDAA